MIIIKESFSTSVEEVADLKITFSFVHNESSCMRFVLSLGKLKCTFGMFSLIKSIKCFCSLILTLSYTKGG